MDVHGVEDEATLLGETVHVDEGCQEDFSITRCILQKPVI